MGNEIRKETKGSIGLGNVDNTSDATKLEATQDNFGGPIGEEEGFLKSYDEHLSIDYDDDEPSLTLKVNHTLCFFPTGVEFGITDQEYDVDGVTWINAVPGGDLGGIPDETSGGHHLSDCIDAVTTARDGSYLAIREETGAASPTNPLTVHFLFTGITAFDTLDLRMLYVGSPSHVIGIELWNYTDTAWDRIIISTSLVDYIEISKKIFGSSNYIGTGGDEGNVILQLIHDQAGIASHRYEFDVVSICDGGGGGGAPANAVPLTGGVMSGDLEFSGTAALEIADDAYIFKAKTDNDAGTVFNSTDISIDKKSTTGAVTGKDYLETGISRFGGKRVSADFDKTADTTIATVTGLAVALLASKVYKFSALLFVDADATGGVKVSIGTEDALTATNLIYEVTLLDDTTDAFTIADRGTALAATFADAGPTAGVIEIKGVLEVNAAGTFRIGFAQSVANGVSTVLRGSSLSLEEMA